MDVADTSKNADELKRQDELTKALAKLTPEKQAAYEDRLFKTINDLGEVSHQYRMGIIKTFGQGLPEKSEGIQLKEYYRKEQNLSRETQRTETRDRDALAKEQKAPAPSRDDTGKQQFIMSPKQGAWTRDVTRGYADLQRTHADVVRQQDEQKKSGVQEAARSGAPLTSEQTSNAPADVKQAVDRNERATTARAESKGQNAQQGQGKPGNSRPTGRSR